MTVNETPQGMLINLSKAPDKRMKIVNSILGLSYLSVFFLIIGILQMYIDDPTLITYLVLAVFTVLYFYIGYLFMNKAYTHETILIHKGRLTLTRGALLSRKKMTYEIAGITNFRLLDKKKTAQHLLSGESFDYRRRQHVIRNLISEDKLAFDYQDRTITFGEKIYSPDFEQLKLLVYPSLQNH